MDEQLGSLVIRRPAAAVVFKQLGIDLALEHSRTLEDAAAMRDLRTAEVLARITAVEKRAVSVLADWSPLQSQRPFFSTWQPAQYLPLESQSETDPDAPFAAALEPDPSSRPSVVAHWP
jgi:hypothetical protein